MSDVPAHDHRPDTGFRWIPLSLSVGLVFFALVVVSYHQLTDHETVPLGADRKDTVGTVVIDREADGTIIVIESSTNSVVAAYPPSREQFLSGAVRSLDRMHGGPGAALGRSYHVMRVGVSTVLLEDTNSGAWISLNAFNRSASLSLAEQVLATNGGKQ